MRVLYAMVGEPGSGKSTFIENTGLQDLVVSTDALRNLFSGKEYGWDSTNERVTIGTSQKENKEVFSLLEQILIKKAEQGRTIIVDSTHLYKGAFATYRKLKEKYGYRIYAVDMRAKKQGLSLEELQRRNASLDRVANGKVVSKSTIKKFWDRAVAFKSPSFVNDISPRDFENTMKWLPDNIDESSYTSVKVIGDIHGSFDVLKEGIGELKPDTRYVFVGDYLDRGTQNVETFKYMLKLSKEPNVVLLRGNHELHWGAYLNETPIKSRETRLITFPQLEEAGITKKEIASLWHRLQDVYMFIFHGKEYLVTHAGLPYELVSSRYDDHGMLEVGDLPEDVFTRGVGRFSADVDKDYREHTSSILPIQVHGHRNEFHVKDDKYIYNLERGVDKGDYLAILNLSSDGTHKVELIKNNNARPDMLENSSTVDISKLDNKTMMAVLVASKNINNVTVEDNIIANNFNENAFINNDFNTFSVTARGLFTTKTGEVLGRGFNKFFNYQVVDDDTPAISVVTDEKIAEHPLPAVATKKYDGFLTLVFVVNNELKVFSKGGDTDYAKIAKEDLLGLVSSVRHTSEKGAEALLVDWFNKQDKKYTIVMETVDTRDAHIVEYNRNHQVVLSAVEDSYVLKENFDIADMFSELFGLRRPETKLINTQEDLNNIIELTRGENAFHDGYEQEGYVVRMNDGFRFKLKNNWYLSTKELMQKLSTISNKPEEGRKQLPKHPSYDESVRDTLDSLVRNLTDRELLDLPVRVNRIDRSLSELGSVDVKQVIAKYPFFIRGKFREDIDR